MDRSCYERRPTATTKMLARSCLRARTRPIGIVRSFTTTMGFTKDILREGNGQKPEKGNRVTVRLFHLPFIDNRT
jgi:hypothetical protein